MATHRKKGGKSSRLQFLEMIQNINCKDEPSVENAIYTRGAVAVPSEMRGQRVPLRQSRKDEHPKEIEASFCPSGCLFLTPSSINT